MKRRWSLLLVVLALPMLMGSLPSGVENAIRGWFDGAGRVAIVLKERLAPNLSTGECVFYNDKTTHTAQLRCKSTDGESATVLLGATACETDSAGNMECNTFTSRDQNTLAVPAANRNSLYDNDVDLTPNPTCAALGLDGQMRWFDQDESTVDAYVPCTGTQPFWVSTFTQLFGNPETNVGQAPSANECDCYLGNNPNWIRDLDNVQMVVTTADAATTGTSDIAIYSPDGQVQYFQATVTTGFQATGEETIANSITAPPAVPPGPLLFCLTVSTNAADLRLEGVRDSSGGVPQIKWQRYLSTGSACNGGAAPATLTPTYSFATADPWYVSLSDN